MQSQLRRTAQSAVLAILGGVALTSADAAPLRDAEVIAIYIQVNGFDIETALLGRAQAHLEGVRKLAQHVATDHLAVREAAFALAASCKVAPLLPRERDTDAIDHGRTMSTLLALEGAAFDRAYLQHEVEFHTAAIAAVRNALLPGATCPQLRKHLQEVLPAFEHHLAETRALARDISG